MQSSKALVYTLPEVNGWDHAAFTRILGQVFEHSPWVAQRTWRKRPFSGLEALHHALCETVMASTEEEQLALIRAHPDLAERAAVPGGLTASSAQEQTIAGLDKLGVEEIRLLKELNQAYRGKFGFPFIICARLNKKAAILDGVRPRLAHARAEEIRRALEEIGKIAYLRLQDIIQP
jgi:2-oxo-4-hydroxy-4-carboxy-5-ureidoimidazoline decarboxylase